MSRYALCPCDSKVFYHKCCGRYHSGTPAETALLLMRSRYSAYAMGLVDYIMDTTHPENPQYNLDRIGWKHELEAFAKGTQFIFLKILDFVQGDEIAYVTFNASLVFRGRDASFTEKSTFVKDGDRWY